MLPKKIKEAVFESLSVKTMRYVDAVPTAEATGLLAELYQQIAEDFFINGSLTSHSTVPELLAGAWAVGREAILQPEYLDQKTKEAMAATLSRVNDCAYCGDMLISLVHSAGDPKAAKGIFKGDESDLPDKLLEERLQWVGKVASPDGELPAQAPFSSIELPEAIAALVAMSHINRYSHVVMDGSPVPFGQSQGKYMALSMFSLELKDVVARELVPGRALSLVESGPLPEQMQWAKGNTRIAAAMTGWSLAIDKYARPAIPDAVHHLVEARVSAWQGESMPMSRSWVDEAVASLDDKDQDVARLCLVVAISPWQFSDDLLQPLIKAGIQKPDLVRVLNYAAFTGARRFGQRLGDFYLSEADIFSGDLKTASVA